MGWLKHCAHFGSKWAIRSDCILGSGRFAAIVDAVGANGLAVDGFVPNRNLTDVLNKSSEAQLKVLDNLGCTGNVLLCAWLPRGTLV